MWEPEFEGYWSETDKEIWQNTDWKARNYEDLPVGDEIIRPAYFYEIGVGSIEKPLIFVRQKPFTFVKYIRANPIYPPYYGPVMTKELIDFTDHKYVGAMYGGYKEGNYDIHDRFETQELYDSLSH